MNRPLTGAALAVVLGILGCGGSDSTKPPAAPQVVTVDVAEVEPNGPQGTAYQFVDDTLGTNRDFLITGTAVGDGDDDWYVIGLAREYYPAKISLSLSWQGAGDLEVGITNVVAYASELALIRNQDSPGANPEECLVSATAPPGGYPSEILYQ